MTRKTKTALWWTVPPALAAIAAGLFVFLSRPDAAGASTAGGSYDIVEVERLTLSDGIEISGNIEAADAADLAFSIAGYIDAVYVGERDSVEVGDVVAVLEDSQQRYDLAEVEVEIDSEQVAGTQRNLALLELKREMVESSLDDTRLKSTVAGLVSEVNNNVGDFVTAQEAGSADDVVVRVIDRSSMTAVVEVDELDAPYLEIGQVVEFRFDAYPDLEITGEVTSIPLEARQTDQGIAVLDTEVTIFDPPDEILPSFTFAGEILLGADESLLLLPEEAVQSRGGRTMVLAVMTEEAADALRAEGPSFLIGGSDPAAGSGAVGSTASGSGAGGSAAAGERPPVDPPNLDGLNLPAGYTVVPVPVSVAEYGSGKVRIQSGLDAGDRVLVPDADGSGGTAVETAVDGENRSVMELLGMPSPGNRGGGAPPDGPPN